MSISDEVKRLHELHQAGALSDAEFEQAKARLFASPPPAASGNTDFANMRRSRNDRWLGGVCGGLATITGPTLGGLLVTALDWRYIFLVNLPVGAVALVLGWRLIPADTPTGRRPALDLPGVLLATAALTLVSFALIEGERFDWGTVYGPIGIPLLLGLGAALFAALAVQQVRRQGRDPLVPFALFADRNFGLMSLAASLVSVTRTSKRDGFVTRKIVAASTCR